MVGRPLLRTLPTSCRFRKYETVLVILVMIFRTKTKTKINYNVSLINDSRLFFKFLLPSEILEKENKNFSITLCAVPTYYIIFA